jgi:hypothetical protein
VLILAHHVIILIPKFFFYETGKKFPFPLWLGVRFRTWVSQFFFWFIEFMLLIGLLDILICFYCIYLIFKERRKIFMMI